MRARAQRSSKKGLRFWGLGAWADSLVDTKSPAANRIVACASRHEWPTTLRLSRLPHATSPTVFRWKFGMILLPSSALM